jgi:hypothetical protein
MGAEYATGVCAEGPFQLADGPISPDHIVYMKAYALVGEPTADALAAFERRHGYLPRVLGTAAAVFAVGTSESSAALAMELAKDGALVRQLAAAFGGVVYMDERAAGFIDRWEVEAYRRKVAGADKGA